MEQQILSHPHIQSLLKHHTNYIKQDIEGLIIELVYSGATIADIIVVIHRLLDKELTSRGIPALLQNVKQNTVYILAQYNIEIQNKSTFSFNDIVKALNIKDTDFINYLLTYNSLHEVLEKLGGNISD